MNDIKKLKDAGLHTAERVAMTSKRKLAQIKGISDQKAEKIAEAANKIQCRVLDFRSATEVKLEREQV